MLRDLLLRPASIVPPLLLLATLLACGQGGKNFGQQGAGDVHTRGGVALAIGDIAVAPTGGYVIFDREGELAVAWTRSGRIDPLPVENARRLVFSRTRPVVYVTTTARHTERPRVVAVDVMARSVLWSAELDADRATRLVSTRDDRFVIAWLERGVVALDTETGGVATRHAFPRRIVDVQALPDGGRALVVEAHAWEGDTPRTRVSTVRLDEQESVTFDVPNCADRPALSPDGSRAFLAPTTCARDPISVLDLTEGQERFERNLPGFGPVVLAPDGALAVGFLDATNIEEPLFDDPEQIPDPDGPRYHLMLIDPGTLGFDVVEVGEHLPRFAVTPDGHVLLVDSRWNAEIPARILDTAEREWRSISGAPVLLDHFVITSDSRHAYVVRGHFYDGLFDIDLEQATSTRIPLSFSPTNINISPDDRTLYLRVNEERICIFSLETRKCEAHFEAVLR